MKVSYSAQLMEESVFRHLNHLERSGYRSDYDEFHSLADPIYELPEDDRDCLLYTSPSPRDATLSRMPSSA